MAPIRLAGLPRRSRVLLIVVVLCCTLLLLPAPRERVGQALLFTFFSPHSWHTRNGESAGPDILRFIDPLIGTTNGGGCAGADLLLASLCWSRLTWKTGHVFPGATLPYGEWNGHPTPAQQPASACAPC